MLSASAKLKKLDDALLIDVVKNYRQYGYAEELREAALSILAERGISRDYLKLTGNFDNYAYDYGMMLHRSFRLNSKLAFLMYLSIVLIYLFQPLFFMPPTLVLVLSLLHPMAGIFFFFFLVKAYLLQCEFYKAMGKNYGTEGALLYFFLGIPLYLIMYFYFRQQMLEKIKEIR